ncbi:hypothetical protein [Niallia sp. MER TA 168]|uniref:hypothetical protein n=1 Tax=Niallia sp. MER TA 168 TaxID=2939568 RepID=UPI00203FE080|nr:hypothetical protein [Niallia sp. MER TA 168]MCM3362025.1 hypothetical protein [Niallia sp. MER TA 168]
MRSDINTADLESILSVIEDDNRYIRKLNLEYRIKDNKFYIGCVYGDTFNTLIKKNYLEALSKEVINMYERCLFPLSILKIHDFTINIEINDRGGFIQEEQYVEIIIPVEAFDKLSTLSQLYSKFKKLLPLYPIINSIEVQGEKKRLNQIRIYLYTKEKSYLKNENQTDFLGQWIASFNNFLDYIPEAPFYTKVKVQNGMLNPIQLINEEEKW